jgi:signal transduction histidine kinase
MRGSPLPALIRPTRPLLALGMVFAAGCVVVETLVVWALRPLATPDVLLVVYLVGVLLVSVVWGRSLAAATAVVSILTYDYFFIPPAYGLRVSDSRDWLTIPLFCLLALLASSIAEAARTYYVEAAQRKEASLAAEMAHLLLRAGDVRSALPDVSRTLARALELPCAAIELDAVASDQHHAAIPLRDGAAVIGTLLVPSGLPHTAMLRLHERVKPSLEALLRAACDREAIGNALEASRDELAASRERVVNAADESRRRIERNLHDGAQQRLVSLSLELRSVEAMAPPELKQLREQLLHTAQGLAGVVEDLQELSRGLHPAILSKAGLGPALRMLARRSAIPVELHLHTDRRLAERVEAASYYIVAEALANTAKHAHASMVHIELDDEDSTLQLSIRDDGVGGADPGRGSGLIGLRDRVEALGGRIEITSPAGQGTSLQAKIPITATD